MAALDESLRNPFAMARFLDVDRTACQRLYSSVATVDESTVAKAPGPKSLRRIADAVEAKGLDPAVAAGLRDAAAKFESFLSETGGNQRAFSHRLLLTQQPRGVASVQVTENRRAVQERSEQYDHEENHGGWLTASPDNARSREQLFEAARGIVGRWSEVASRIYIMNPSEGAPNVCDEVRAVGYIGHIHTANAQPLVSMNQYAIVSERPDVYKELVPRKNKSLPNFVLEAFSSSTWRASSYVDGNVQYHIVANSEQAVDTPGDLVLANISLKNQPYPINNSPYEIWKIIEYPAKRLVQDVYLHSSLARNCKSGADAHTMRVTAEYGRKHLRWMTRIGSPGALSFLGTGTAGAGCDAYPRHQALLQYLFDTMGWNADEFVGFRHEVVYPIWRAAYRTYFDFEQSPSAQ